jgi:hypothetical protein
LGWRFFDAAAVGCISIADKPDESRALSPPVAVTKGVATEGNTQVFYEPVHTFEEPARALRT